MHCSLWLELLCFCLPLGQFIGVQWKWLQKFCCGFNCHQPLLENLSVTPCFAFFACQCFISHSRSNIFHFGLLCLCSSWQGRVVRSRFALLLEFLENSLKIQFWHQLLENSLNLSIYVSCRIKKMYKLSCCSSVASCTQLSFTHFLHLFTVCFVLIE